MHKLSSINCMWRNHTYKIFNFMLHLLPMQALLSVSTRSRGECEWPLAFVRICCDPYYIFVRMYFICSGVHTTYYLFRCVQARQAHVACSNFYNFLPRTRAYGRANNKDAKSRALFAEQTATKLICIYVRLHKFIRYDSNVCMSFCVCVCVRASERVVKWFDFLYRK